MKTEEAIYRAEMLTILAEHEQEEAMLYDYYERMAEKKKILERTYARTRKEVMRSMPVLPVTECFA